MKHELEELRNEQYSFMPGPQEDSPVDPDLPPQPTPGKPPSQE